jgi:cyclophilin family peptidyl-prolyl cis-trans isomerase
MRRRLLIAALLAAGLPAAAQVAPPAPAAELLSLEDRRTFDEAVLRRHIDDSSPAVRRRAALAAGRIRDRRAVPLLMPLLGDPDSSVAATTAFALGLIGDTTAVPELTRLLNVVEVRRAPSVVAEAATALGRLRSAASRTALEEYLRGAPSRGPGAGEVLAAALLAVWRFPRPADPTPIIPWLDSPDTALAWRAAYALSRRPDPAATTAAVARLDRLQPLARSFALRLLSGPLADSSGVGREVARQALVSAATSGDHSVSVNAIRALGTYPDSLAVDALRSLLSDADAYRAITAAESLGRIGTGAAPAAPALATTARANRRPVALRLAALAALADVAPELARPVVAELAGAAEWRLRAAAAAAAADLADWERVGALSRDRDARVAAATIDGAVNALGDSVGRIRNLLVEALGNPDPVVRTNALNGFARLADPSDVPLLLDAYDRAQRDTLLNDAALAAVGAIAAVAKKNQGVAARAFFTRFPRAADYLVRLGAAAAFGDSVAAAAWGAPHPIEAALTPEAAQSALRDLPRRARIVTSRGTISLELFADDAPLTVRNFASLARRGYFNGQEWPRVVPNFVIQGGDPRGDTSGGPGYAIRDEINRHRYLTGTLGMALSGPDTGGSQWFITHSPQPHLDGTYTVFGRVVEGMDVVNRVLPGDRIERIEVLP